MKETSFDKDFDLLTKNPTRCVGRKILAAPLEPALLQDFLPLPDSRQTQTVLCRALPPYAPLECSHYEIKLTANSRIALCSSKNAVSFSSARTTNRFPSQGGFCPFSCFTFYSRSHHAVIRVYDETGNVIETHEHKADFKEP
jgi:hypothetical protein